MDRRTDRQTSFHDIDRAMHTRRAAKNDVIACENEVNIGYRSVRDDVHKMNQEADSKDASSVCEEEQVAKQGSRERRSDSLVYQFNMTDEDVQLGKPGVCNHRMYVRQRDNVNLSVLVAWNSANKQTTIVNGQAGAEEATVAYLEVVEFSSGSLGVATCLVRREAVAAVDVVEVHHQSQLVQLAEPL